MDEIFGGLGGLVWVAAKALLLYLTAVIGFRLSHRRTLAEMTGFDFVAAVAVGAIVGRVPNADGTSYLAGAATLVAVLAAHACLTRLRLRPLFARALDHAPRVLVIDGSVQDSQVRRAGLTRADLHALLRQRGVYDLRAVKYAIFEQRGSVSIVLCDDVVGEQTPILGSVLRSAGVGQARA